MRKLTDQDVQFFNKKFNKNAKLISDAEKISIGDDVVIGTVMQAKDDVVSWFEGLKGKVIDITNYLGTEVKRVMFYKPIVKPDEVIITELFYDNELIKIS